MRFSDSELRILEELSFSNFINFYRAELLAFSRGEKIDRHDHRLLKRAGALIRIGIRTKLSPRALNILNLTDDKNTRIEPVGALQDPPRGAKIGIKEVKTNEC